MDEVLFFIAGIGAVAGAIAVVTLRNPFYSVLALVSHLFSLAVLFLLLMAQFVAAAQIVVYAGAVMVLYVFVVAYIGGSDQPIGPQSGRRLTGLAILAAAGLFVVLVIATLGSGLAGIDSEGAGDEEHDLLEPHGAYSPSRRSGVCSGGSARSISLVKMRSDRV